MHESSPDNERLDPWLNGESSGDNLPEEAEMKRILLAASRLQVPEGIGKEEAWLRFEARTGSQARPKVKYMPGRWIAVAAAVIVLFIGAWVFWPEAEVLRQTQRAEQLTFLLPDGSRVNLNAESELNYNPSTWNTARTVTLQGEAFFEVEKGTPFTVQTPNGQVEVLGTSFNVFDRKQGFEVACITGKVRVQTPDQSSQILLPGQAAHTPVRGKLEVFTFNEKSPARWQKGEFYFEKTPINHVIAVLERQYDVEIEGPEFSGRTYTGYFTNQNLEESLKLVFVPLAISYSWVDSRRIRLRDAVIHE